MVTITRVPRDKHTMIYVVLHDGVEVGIVTKTRDTRTDIHPFKAFKGVGVGQRFVAAFYTGAQISRIEAGTPGARHGLQTGGRDAAINAVINAWTQPRWHVNDVCEVLWPNHDDQPENWTWTPGIVTLTRDENWSVPPEHVKVRIAAGHYCLPLSRVRPMERA